MSQGDNDSVGLSLRLTARQWLAAVVIAAVSCLCLPVLWERLETIEPGADDRVPYSLSRDYWLFERYAEKVRSANRVLVVGDSVVWGEYVMPSEALSSRLNRLSAESGGPRYGNLGLNGSHPLALEGLIRYHTPLRRGDRVLLNFNPLWMSSPRHDLQLEKEFHFNHSGLVAQFWPWIPCYRAGLSERLGIAIERRSAVLGWANHLRIAYYGSRDLYRWTLENPLSNPLAPLGAGLPAPLARPRHRGLPWLERGQKQDFPWVKVESSLQWRAFERTVAFLGERGCDVFVLFGPFNEHMLEEPSLARYRELTKRCLGRLEALRIPSFSPEALPSELYADASHPLAAGYALLAERLLDDEAFGRWAK